MKRKWFIYLFGVLATSLILVSCVDESDFAFDKMTDTTVNPHLHMKNILSTEIKMSDFFNLDSIVDTAKNVQLVRHIGSGADTGYWEFIVGIDTTLKPTMPAFQTPNPINVTIPLSSALYSPGIAGDIYYPYLSNTDPSLTQPMAVSSTQIPTMENGQRLDSIAFSAGAMVLTFNSSLNKQGEIWIECSELRNKTTGQIFRDTITISSSKKGAKGIITSNVNLANYVLSSSATSSVDFKYRVHVVSDGSVISLSDVQMNIAFQNLCVDYVYGNIGTQRQWFNDDLNVNLFDNEDVAKIFGGTALSIESMYLDLSFETNMGLPINMYFDTLWTYNKNTNTYSSHLITDASDRIIGINAAANLNITGLTTKRIALNTHLADNLPTSLLYAGHLEVNPNATTGFEMFDSWLGMSMKLHIPFKAKIQNMTYEIDLGDLALKDAEEYINKTSLIFDIENYFPCSIGTVIRCYDKNGVQIGSDIISNAEIVAGASVDSKGNILSPSHKTSTLTVSQQDVKWINSADKVKLILTLNTSSSSGVQPYICFDKDSKVKVKVGVDYESNITIK